MVHLCWRPLLYSANSGDLPSLKSQLGHDETFLSFDETLSWRAELVLVGIPSSNSNNYSSIFLLAYLESMIPAPPREKRLYTRYPFEAHAEIIASDVEWSLRVTNISFGGCRLLTNGLIPEGSTITIRIRTQTDSFMATAKVMHSTADDVGVMFDEIRPESLPVLQKWINAAKSAHAA
jgi:hypothetical protein